MQDRFKKMPSTGRNQLSALHRAKISKFNHRLIKCLLFGRLAGVSAASLTYLGLPKNKC